MKKQRLAIISAIRVYWVSADSHLDWCIQRNPKGKDDRKFHVETTIEYLEEMLKLAKALR